MNNNLLTFYVGGYAEPGQRGILKCAFDGQRFRVLYACDALNNPSWLLQHPSKPLLYAVEELAPVGRVAVLSDSGDGLKALAAVSTGGADPCHIAMSPDERHLLVANYTGGSLAVYALDDAGMIAGQTDFLQHRMPAARRADGNPARQEAAHIHFSLCDGQRVFVNDLGLNRVFIYGWDAVSGKLIDRGETIEFPAGAGPRHLAFGEEGNHLYVLCELNATIHAFERQPDGGWQRVQEVSTVPEDFTAFEQFAWSAGAAIHLADARTLCASTRGHDSIAVFRIDARGRLSGRQIVPSGGRTPRDFMPAGKWLLVANQDSDGLGVLSREGGAYAPAAGALNAIHPTCLCPAEGQGSAAE